MSVVHLLFVLKWQTEDVVLRQCGLKFADHAMQQSNRLQAAVYGKTHDLSKKKV
jgi:hypothetical protein